MLIDPIKFTNIKEPEKQLTIWNIDNSSTITTDKLLNKLNPPRSGSASNLRIIHVEDSDGLEKSLDTQVKSNQLTKYNFFITDDRTPNSLKANLEAVAKFSAKLTENGRKFFTSIWSDKESNKPDTLTDSTGQYPLNSTDKNKLIVTHRTDNNVDVNRLGEILGHFDKLVGLPVAEEAKA